MFEVRDNPEDARFDAFLDGRRIGELTYSIDGLVITLIHTGIRSEHERQGYGTTLVTQALDLIRDTGMSVIAVCDFARSVIDARPEYGDLLKEA
ncbi:MAG TPA: GNAT family N-acetyltransferase [Nocardioidaceae bacterium]|nr:GNAT family N-acetyltransferase [Nocardioidaceae bacterium]